MVQSAETMDVSVDKVIDMNTSGLVLMACSAHGIRDMKQIEIYKEWVKQQIIHQMEEDHAEVDGLPKIMDEKLELLKQKLRNGESVTISSPEDKLGDVEGSPSPDKLEDIEEEKEPKEAVVSSGYKPKAKDMPTKLANERKPVKKIIMEDCVQLGLLKKKRAEYLVTQMAGKQPMDAEKEVVAELRKNLHEQVRKLIRKDKEGPWSSPMAQEELRLEIVQTPTVRSMVFLTREILREREDWKSRSKNSITGRIFGKKMTLDK